MMALYDREHTGMGQRIDTAMLDCLFSVFETRLPGCALNGVDIGVEPKYDTGDPLACRPTFTTARTAGSASMPARIPTTSVLRRSPSIPASCRRST